MFFCREQLKENAKLVLEENQNLLEQINIKDQKAHDLQQAHIREGKISFNTKNVQNLYICRLYNSNWSVNLKNYCLMPALFLFLPNTDGFRS